MSSPPLKKLKNTAEDADEQTQNRETPMHIISTETQNTETQNRETQKNETQNTETQNRETQKNETQNTETQNRETQNNETQNRETQNTETQNSETQNTEAQNNGAQNREIPSEIIETKILPRLPANSLLRFKSVRKDWYRLISSSEFINDHIRHLNYLSSRSILSISHNSTLIAFDYGDSQNVQFINFGQYSTTNPIFLIGSCNGLVLLIRSHALNGQLLSPIHLLKFGFDYCVYNPVLRSDSVIPHPQEFVIRSIYPAAYDYSFGFGYTSTPEDYYIVAINFPVFLNLPLAVVFVFLCKSRKWVVNEIPRNIEKHGRAVVFEDAWYDHSGMLVNEALHWGISVTGTTQKYIVVLDLVSRELSLTELPCPNFGDFRILHPAFSLGCLNDCLCAWAYSEAGKVVDLWILREYGVWNRLFRIDMETTYSYFFGLTKPKEVMIFNFDWLIYLDFSRVPPQRVLVDIENQLNAVNYVQSLLSPHAIIKYPASGEENE